MTDPTAWWGDKGVASDERPSGERVRVCAESPVEANRVAGKATLDVVEMYPYVPYLQYLLPGSIVMSMKT